MNLRVENNKVMLEFPLTQAKPAWRMRRANGSKKSPDLKYVIEKGDTFEWMVTNEEVRDMVSALRCICPENYKQLKDSVFSITTFRSQYKDKIGDGIDLEARSLPKQRKPSELTPYLFVLLSLDRTTSEHYVVDKKGRRVGRTIGYSVRVGDKLVWVVRHAQIGEIAKRLASLSRMHCEMVKKRVLAALENQSSTHQRFIS